MKLLEMNTHLNRPFSKEIIQMVYASNHQRNTNQSHREGSPHCLQEGWLFSNNGEYEALGMGYRKGNSCTMSAGMQIHTAVTRNSMGVIQNFKNRTTVWSKSNSTPGYIPRGNENSILNSYLYTSLPCFFKHQLQ